MTDSEDTPAVPSELEVLLGDPSILHLDGADIDVRLEELRTRQLFKFLRIITNGAGAALADLEIGPDTDAAELTSQLIAILLVAVPNSEDEVIEFIQSMISPMGIIEPERSKTDRQINVEKYTELYTLLQNPKPQDSIAILIKTIQNETPNLMALGKQIAVLLPSAATPTSSSKKPSKK